MGVNVWFWGPPGWRVSFAIAKISVLLVTHYRRTRQTRKAGAVVQWASRTLRAFFNAPPCVFCRRSCPQFVRELEAETGARMEDQLWAGKGLDFVFALRSKVNMKLHTQHLRQFSQLSGVTFDGHVCSIPPRTITFATWRARLMLQERMFTTQDVILLLNALRLDHQSDLGRHYATFLHGLSILTRLESRQHDAPRNLFAPMRMLSELMLPIGRMALLQPDMVASRHGFERIVFQIMCGMKGLRPTAGQYERVSHALFAPYNIMQAGVVCQKETCAVPTAVRPQHLTGGMSAAAALTEVSDGSSAGSAGSV